MYAVIQRVKHTSLTVDGKLISEIPYGLVVYLGVKVGDSEDKCEVLANKVSKLRIFEDANGKMNLSIKDVGGEILLVSQFTLCADCTRGNRPNFSMAERPERAIELYELTASKLRNLGLIVKLSPLKIVLVLTIFLFCFSFFL